MGNILRAILIQGTTVTIKKGVVGVTQDTLSPRLKSSSFSIVMVGKLKRQSMGIQFDNTGTGLTVKT